LLLADCKDFHGSVYALRQCRDCSFVTLYPLASEEILRHCYDAGYWQQPVESPFNLVSLFLSLRMRGILAELRRFLPEKARVLDWGAGDGSWLRLVRKAGFEAWGFDRYAASPYDRYVSNATIETVDFPEEYFDAITCFHVLEHLHNPVEDLRKALKILKPAGLIIAEVPNVDSWGFKLFKRRWQPLQIPSHLNYFNPETLVRVFKVAGGAEVVKLSYFSHRASPAALALSLLPSLDPRSVRQRTKGCYPFLYRVLYLIVQIIFYPAAILAGAAGKGSIIRIYIRKK